MLAIKGVFQANFQTIFQNNKPRLKTAELKYFKTQGCPAFTDGPHCASGTWK
jgi:hypothetical protein